MKNITNFVLLSVLLLSTVLSCNLFGAISGSGELAKETRSVDIFHSIIIDGLADVTVSQDVNQSLVVETDENLLNLLKTNVTEGVLTISFKKKNVNPTRVNITISMAELRELQINGDGAIRSGGDLSLDDLNVSIKGSGEVDLSGTGSSLNIDISGEGKVKAGELPVDACRVNISGEGDVEVCPNNTLHVTISGDGKVKYHGNPIVTQNITGDGNVSPF
jgi:hypothetical protein